MSLTLLDAETRVRARTRHTNDTARLTSVVVKELLHTAYVELRSELETIVPQLYLAQSSDLVFPDGEINQIDTVAGAVRFTNLYRVEKCYVGTGGQAGPGWRAVQAGSDEEPNVHQAGGPVFWRQGIYINLGPDTHSAATYRIFYHQTPALLVNPSDVFEIPESTIPVLLLKALAWVAFQDTAPPSAAASVKKTHDDMADAALAKISPALRREYGVHGRRHGLKMVMAR